MTEQQELTEQYQSLKDEQRSIHIELDNHGSSVRVRVKRSIPGWMKKAFTDFDKSVGRVQAPSYRARAEKPDLEQYRVTIFSGQTGSQLDINFKVLHKAVAVRDLAVFLYEAISKSRGVYSPQLEAQLLWIWTFTTYRSKEDEALDEKAFKHLYTAFLQSEPRDEALDVVAWAKSFDHDQVLVPGPAHVTDLISSIIAWAENMQQPQQPLQAAPQQLLPLGGTSPARDAFPDLRLRSLSPDPSDRLQNPAEQQSAFTGQFWHDTEGSDYSEQPHGPSCHQAEAALGTTQDAALGARTVSLSAGLDMYSAADMPNQYVPQRTPVRDDQPPWSVVDYTAASSQAMSLHNAVVGPLTGDAATVAQPAVVTIGRATSLETWQSRSTAEQSASQSSSSDILLQPVDCLNEEAGGQTDRLSGMGTRVQSGAHSTSRKRARDVNLAAGAALDNSEHTGDATDRTLALELLQETSSERGDLAYWRPRCVGAPCMQTGEIALIRDGQLHCIPSGSSYQHAADDQFAIVSDRYVRWKGGRIPSAKEEPKGHWCAAIGQLPVMVTGKVDCNEFIVASLTDPPMGQSLATASDPSARQRAVAFTLAAKQTDAPGPVMAFVLFALPAISQLIKTEVAPLQSRVDQVAAELQDLKQTTAHQVEQLSGHLKELELNSKAEAEVMKAQVTQNTADIDQIKLAHLMLLPSKPAARLQHLPALAEACNYSSPPTETIIGQDGQLRGLLGLVADSSNKRNVVIITGAPGMGKTTLANAFRQQLLTTQQVADTFFADLKEVESIEEGLLKVLSALEGAEGLSPAVGDSRMESRDANVVLRQICSLLRVQTSVRRICLVIDNAEDLLCRSGDAPVVEFEAALTKILGCVPSMMVVITSRETPQFLKLVPNIHIVRMTGLSAKDAQELLCLLSPGITPVSAELLAAECGHIPYAISLIGKSMFLNGISAEDMADHLREAGFAEGLKYASQRALADMQKCVRSSLQLLKPNYRLSLAQLSIFPSKFGLAAAAAVLGISPCEAQTQLNLLQRLSLIIKDEAQSQPQLQPQYQLHLFIRDMALSGFAGQPEYLEAQSRFLHHFATMLKATQHRGTPAGVDCLRQLAQERHNLIKMFAILADKPQPASVNMSVCCSLGKAALDAIWVLRLDLNKVFAAMENLLTWAAASGSHSDSFVDAQEQLGFMLTFSYKQIDYAEGLLTAALEARRQGKHAPELHVLSLFGLADVMNTKINASDIDESEGYLQGRLYSEEAHGILLNACGESHPVTLWAAWFSCTFIQDESEQIQAITTVLASAQVELPDHHPTVLHIKSELAVMTRSIPLLREHLGQCQSQAGHNELLVPEAMLMLGEALAHSQHPSQQREEGLQYIRDGLGLAEAVYPIEDIIVARQETLGRALIAMNKVNEAIQVLEDSLPLCEAATGQDSRITWLGYTILADAHEAKGDYEAAATVFKIAHGKIKQSAKRSCGKQSAEVFVVKSGIWCQLAWNLELRGRFQEAHDMHTEAIRLVGRSQAAWFPERGQHFILLASLFRRQGLFEEAEELVQQATIDAHEDASQLQWIALEKALLATDLGQPGIASDQLVSLTETCVDDHKLLLKACICLGWLSFCQEDWSQAMEQFEKAISMSDHFADGGINLEMAISYAGAAAAQVQSADARQGRKLLYEEKAAQYLHLFPFKQADGVQIVKYCLGICMELQDHKQAHQLFADALMVQCKVYADGHTTNALFLQKVQVKAHELSRATLSIVVNTTGPGMTC